MLCYCQFLIEYQQAIRAIESRMEGPSAAASQQPSQAFLVGSKRGRGAFESGLGDGLYSLPLFHYSRSAWREVSKKEDALDKHKAAVQHLSACQAGRQAPAELTWALAHLHFLSGNGQGALVAARDAAKEKPKDRDLAELVTLLEAALAPVSTSGMEEPTRRRQAEAQLGRIRADPVGSLGAAQALESLLGTEGRLLASLAAECVEPLCGLIDLQEEGPDLKSAWLVLYRCLHVLAADVTSAAERLATPQQSPEALESLRRHHQRWRDVVAEPYENRRASWWPRVVLRTKPHPLLKAVEDGDVSPGVQASCALLLEGPRSRFGQWSQDVLQGAAGAQQCTAMVELSLEVARKIALVPDQLRVGRKKHRALPTATRPWNEGFVGVTPQAAELARAGEDARRRGIVAFGAQSDRFGAVTNLPPTWWALFPKALLDRSRVRQQQGP